MSRARASLGPLGRLLLVSMGAFVAASPVVAQEEGEAPEPPIPYRESRSGAFVLTRTVTLPASPDSVWSVITGDLLPWWDHHASEHPRRLYLEPELGGCFCEIFDEEGNGVRHAEVTYVRRGETIVFEGPLGLMGNALHMVTTYQLEAEGDSTRMLVEIHGAGEVREGWPAAIGRAWSHFLEERLKPYMEGRLEE